MGDPERLRRTLSSIDAANADDPHTIVARGETRPKEIAHAELASEWVGLLQPDASDALRIAARAHHLRRWSIPRAEYPEGRAGYHRWRKALQALHADEAARILGAEGWDEATIARVRDLVRKKDLGRDEEVQALEDALCLVFLETQFADLAARLDAGKLVDVVRKTLRKMSPQAIRLATELPLEAGDRALLERAMEGA